MPVQLSASHTGDDHGDEARIEVVPLIDIMFFLLASFVMVSVSMTQLNRVPITAPEASTGIPESKAPPYQIAVDSHGVITWDTKIVTLSEITERLKREANADDNRVMISADAEARHKNVLDVLNAVRAAGIEKIGFETQAPKP